MSDDDKTDQSGGKGPEQAPPIPEGPKNVQITEGRSEPDSSPKQDTGSSKSTGNSKQ